MADEPKPWSVLTTDRESLVLTDHDGCSRREVADCDRATDAAWIALMGPDKADALADLLDEAGDLARFAYVMEGSHAKEGSLSILERTALKLARSILGQGQS